MSAAIAVSSVSETAFVDDSEYVQIADDAAVKALEKGGDSDTSNGCNWAVSDDGVLTIMGSCSMTDFADSSSASLSKWYDYMSMITEINISGVDHIGDYAFYNCSPLKSFDIPTTVTNIGTYAFNGCKYIEERTIPAGVGANFGAALLSC